jgi:hypothetical protein
MIWENVCSVFLKHIFTQDYNEDLCMGSQEIMLPRNKPSFSVFDAPVQ